MACDTPGFDVESNFADERRSASRTTSVYRPVVVELEDFAGFCLIRNLSPGGIMGQVYAELASHQPVTIHFSAENDATGEIVWSQDQRIGVRFDQDIDVNQVLYQLSSKFTGKWINRPPRLQIQCDGTLRVDNQLLPMRVQDISQRGVKVAGVILHPADEVVVMLGEMEPHKAVVRWAQDGMAGLNFFRAISLDELARWAIRKQSKEFI